MKAFFLLFLLVTFLITTSSCKKNNSSAATPPVPPPYLTERTWVLDTITINPPLDFNTLTNDQKLSYQIALGWSKSAELNFHLNQSVTTGGNWNLGYNGWRLINNKADIEVLSNSGKDTLRSWAADTTQLSYIYSINLVNCTLIFK